jgi:hypothetical protein
MATVDQLNQLRRSVDDARELSLSLDLTMTAYILAMACLEIAEAIDGIACATEENSLGKLRDDTVSD